MEDAQKQEKAAGRKSNFALYALIISQSFAKHKNICSHNL